MTPRLIQKMQSYLCAVAKPLRLCVKLNCKILKVIQSAANDGADGEGHDHAVSELKQLNSKFCSGSYPDNIESLKFKIEKDPA